ncbi:MAG: peptide chain release factor aRF-1 [Candidatus Aenigmarchaeota archaeon]|nr:peptide chain release factor aRF-1 [Candidatus Aenigmarchaeota archaeon]
MTEDPKYKLKKLIEDLEKIKGRHTELVSVYIPSGYNINDIAAQIKSEQGTALNIKSKSTRKNVVDALEKIIQHLKLYKETPPNGLVIFCGNVSEKEGVSDIKIWALEPPEPIKIKLYWCDQKFELSPLLEIIKEKEVYGLLVMDTKEATIGILKGKTIQTLRKLDSIVPGKFIKGGQSQMRFQRVREGLINDFFKEIAESVKELLPINILGIIIGGPGPSKSDFYNGDYLDTELKKKVLDVVDVGYTDEYGLQELVEKSKNVLSGAAIQKEKEILNKFFTHLQKETGLVTYGLESVKNAVIAGAVETILISENLEYYEFEIVCSCGNSEKVFGKSEENIKCSSCNSKPNILGKRGIIESFEDLAKEYGTNIELISRDTKEGEQFYGLGGIGAILRWKIE